MFGGLQCGFTSFVDMKKVWIGRKFTYIFEAAPSSNLAFFMQSIYAQSISTLSHDKLGHFCIIFLEIWYFFWIMMNNAGANVLFVELRTLILSTGYMLSTASLSHRLGGLYCLYCLYETQPFKPPYKIYLSIGMIFRSL